MSQPWNVSELDEGSLQELLLVTRGWYAEPDGVGIATACDWSEVLSRTLVQFSHAVAESQRAGLHLLRYYVKHIGTLSLTLGMYHSWTMVPSSTSGQSYAVGMPRMTVSAPGPFASRIEKELGCLVSRGVSPMLARCLQEGLTLAPEFRGGIPGVLICQLQDASAWCEWL